MRRWASEEQQELEIVSYGPVVPAVAVVVLFSCRGTPYSLSNCIVLSFLEFGSNHAVLASDPMWTLPPVPWLSVSSLAIGWPKRTRYWETCVTVSGAVSWAESEIRLSSLYCTFAFSTASILWAAIDASDF